MSSHRVAHFSRHSCANFHLPRAIPVSVRSFPEQVNHDHPRDEASNMRPESNSTRSLTGFSDRGSSATQEIHHEPVAEHQPSRNVKEKYRKKPDQHACPRI